MEQITWPLTLDSVWNVSISVRFPTLLKSINSRRSLAGSRRGTVVNRLPLSQSWSRWSSRKRAPSSMVSIILSSRTRTASDPPWWPYSDPSDLSDPRTRTASDPKRRRPADRRVTWVMLLRRSWRYLTDDGRPSGRVVRWHSDRST
jgi:hypothetical protein